MNVLMSQMRSLMEKIWFRVSCERTYTSASDESATSMKLQTAQQQEVIELVYIFIKLFFDVCRPPSKLSQYSEEARREESKAKKEYFQG